MEEWTTHPARTRARSRAARSVLRQPGKPRAFLTCPRPHGFASPPYDGFARAKRSEWPTTNFFAVLNRTLDRRIGAAGAVTRTHRRVPGRNAGSRRSIRGIGPHPGPGRSATAIVPARCDSRAALLVGAEQRAIGLAGQSTAMLGPGRFQDGRGLEQVPGGGGEGAGGEDHPLAADARPPGGDRLPRVRRSPRDPASRRETGRRHDPRDVADVGRAGADLPGPIGDPGDAPQGGRARSPARVLRIPSANADSSAS